MIPLAGTKGRCWKDPEAEESSVESVAGQERADVLTVRGVVEPGDQRGRTLGFPTANIALPDEAGDVEDGVWAGWVERADGTRLTAAVSIGRRPTYYGSDGLRLIEAHVLDFDGDLYGEVLTVYLRCHLRAQRAFDSGDALIAALAEDVAATRIWSEAATGELIPADGRLSGLVHYDVAAIRRHFPALAEGAAHFDGPGGSQMPDVVADAVAGTLHAAVSNRGTVTAAERRAEEIVTEARTAAADLLGATSSGIVFGRSMTQLTYDFSRTLAKDWRPGDEVVVTRLDHEANIRPWVHAAEATGVTVRWADFDPETGELSADTIAGLLSTRTRLVAVTAASNLLGTRPDIRAITEHARDAGALTYVDGVHLTPHCPVDVTALGADFYACSPYKFLGPHLGLVAADPRLLETLRPDKLLPSPDAVPERFELGTLPYELLAGTTAAVRFLGDLVPGQGSLRERLAISMPALEQYESALLQRLESGLAEIGGVTLHGSPDRRRTPTVLFSLVGVPPDEVYRKLGESGVNAPAGHFYALECSRHLGLGDAGAVRAGIAPYTHESDVDRLVDGVGRIARAS
jgi:cysteine desulfurase family protein (TIGR01976 family)